MYKNINSNYIRPTSSHQNPHPTNHNDIPQKPKLDFSDFSDLLTEEGITLRTGLFAGETRRIEDYKYIVFIYPREKHNAVLAAFLQKYLGIEPEICLQTGEFLLPDIMTEDGTRFPLEGIDEVCWDHRKGQSKSENECVVIKKDALQLFIWCDGLIELIDTSHPSYPSHPSYTVNHSECDDDDLAEY